MSARTPGPWAVAGSLIVGPEIEHDRHSNPLAVRRAPSNIVAQVIDCERGDYLHYAKATADANRVLIAAAPDMLAALRGIVGAWERGDLAAAVRNGAAAIARAEGRP